MNLQEKKPYIEDAAEKKAVYDKAVRTYKGEKDDKVVSRPLHSGSDAFCSLQVC